MTHDQPPLFVYNAVLQDGRIPVVFGSRNRYAKGLLLCCKIVIEHHPYFED